MRQKQKVGGVSDAKLEDRNQFGLLKNLCHIQWNEELFGGSGVKEKKQKHSAGMLIEMHSLIEWVQGHRESSSKWDGKRERIVATRIVWSRHIHSTVSRTKTNIVCVMRVSEFEVKNVIQCWACLPKGHKRKAEPEKMKQERNLSNRLRISRKAWVVLNMLHLRYNFEWKGQNSSKREFIRVWSYFSLVFPCFPLYKPNFFHHNADWTYGRMFLVA